MSLSARPAEAASAIDRRRRRIYNARQDRSAAMTKLLEKNASSDGKPVTTATTQPATDGTTTTTPKTTEVKTGG
jgi:hypothetical protein